MELEEPVKRVAGVSLVPLLVRQALQAQQEALSAKLGLLVPWAQQVLLLGPQEIPVRLGLVYRVPLEPLAPPVPRVRL